MNSSTVPEPVKRIIHAGSRSFGRLTAGSRMLPSFLICGGQRCGTTSLYRALSQHPLVLKAVLHKGVHYFDTNYHRGPDWYRAHFPLRRAAEKLLDEHGYPGQTFESSPYYLYHPHAAARIARDLPGVRVIVLVRDPVERAYSQHAHEVARGFELEADFARALSLEPSRLRGQQARLTADPFAYSFAHQHHAYRARGEYAIALEQMAHQLGRDNILVQEAEEFFTDPKTVYERVQDFLGLPHLGFPEFEQHNARPRDTELPDEIRAELRAHFAPHDAALTAWLGRTPAWRA
ncbi:MAG: sulfotransferase [Hamadaea sp.]|uniref:sulfotransferase family protein n=1 Tax=Hamadaea sp. NPDC050747 TaxID=3155789 RepID=UPI0017D497AE|nr:sulfotransferase [Nonomuraea sp.]NUT02573.1 sulfotransferase [Hamadaea sp.]